MKHFQIEI